MQLYNEIIEFYGSKLKYYQKNTLRNNYEILIKYYDKKEVLFALKNALREEIEFRFINEYICGYCNVNKAEISNLILNKESYTKLYNKLIKLNKDNYIVKQLKIEGIDICETIDYYRGIDTAILNKCYKVEDIENDLYLNEMHHNGFFEGMKMYNLKDEMVAVKDEVIKALSKFNIKESEIDLILFKKIDYFRFMELSYIVIDVIIKIYINLMLNEDEFLKYMKNDEEQLETLTEYYMTDTRIDKKYKEDVNFNMKLNLMNTPRDFTSDFDYEKNSNDNYMVVSKKKKNLINQM